jgi:YVTN family beta-propeller protein
LSRHGISAASAVMAALLAAITAAAPGLASTASAHGASKVSAPTAFVLSTNFGNPHSYLTPIDTATGTAGGKITLGPNAFGDGIAVAPGGKTVYDTVAGTTVGGLHPGSLVPVSAATHQVGKPVKVGVWPNGVAITPNGKTAYVDNSDQNTVTPVNLATGTAAKPIKAGAGILLGTVVTPNGKTVYVASGSQGRAPGTVVPISTATNQPGKPIPVGGTPDDLVVTPNGKTVYVLNQDSDSVTPISTATNTAGKALKIGDGAMVLSPSGKTLYVAGLTKVTPVNTATNRPGKAITVSTLKGYFNWCLAITPNGRTLYVGGAITGDKTPGYVFPIATATGAVAKPVKTRLGTMPFAMSVTPNGATLYVLDDADAGPAGSAIPIDTATSKTGPAISLGGYPSAIVFAP